MPDMFCMREKRIICAGYVLYAGGNENIRRFCLCEKKRLRNARLAVMGGCVILKLRVLPGEENV